MRILTCAIATLLLSCGSNFPLEGEIITEVETEESETTEEGKATEEEDNDTKTSSEGTTEATTTTETDTFDSSDSETDSDSNNSNSETTTNSDSEEYSYEECEETSDCEPFGLGVTCLKVSYPPNSSICTMQCPQVGECEDEKCGCPEPLDREAPTVCQNGYCMLDCSSDHQACPEDMTCILGIPEISGLCFWSSSAP